MRVRLGNAGGNVIPVRRKSEPMGWLDDRLVDLKCHDPPNQP
jgi:hypothetical protein